MKKYILYLLIACLFSSCGNDKLDYYMEIIKLTGGEFTGYSNMSESYIGAPHPQTEGVIFVEGEEVSKKYEYYTPSQTNENVVLGWSGPLNESEYGKIDLNSMKIRWSDENKRFYLSADWKSTDGYNTATLELTYVTDTQDEHCGEIRAMLYTDYWKVWGWSKVGEEKSAKIVKLFEEFYFDTYQRLPKSYNADKNKLKNETIRNQNQPQTNQSEAITQNKTLRDEKDKTPGFYIINVAAANTEQQARNKMRELNNEGYNAGYLWIPDYASLSGAQLYCVYIGPFQTQYECEVATEEYRAINPKAYGLYASQQKKRIQILGIGKVTEMPN